MRKIACGACLLALIAAPGIVQAGEKSDPAERAKAIAPFIDEATVTIVHADMSRLDPAPFVPVVAEMVPGYQRAGQEWRNKAAEQINGLLAALARAGSKDLYVVVSFRSLDWPALVVPLPENTGPARLKELVEEASSVDVVELHGALVAAPSMTFDRLRSLPPDPRPELVQAFEAAGDTAAQVVILPPKHTARVLEAVLPTLPEELGGGPSSVISNGLLWAALGINLTPKVSLQVVTQARDHEAAVALREKWIQITRLLGQNQEFRKIVPNYDQLAPAIVPEVQGDRLVLVHDEDSPGAAALSTALESVISWAGARSGQPEPKASGND